LRIYHLQREEFLPSAYSMIVTLVGLILILLMLTDFGGTAESLVAVGFLSFFFLALLRLLNVISTPFKVGMERTDDDVSMFLLSEFVVQAQTSEEGEVVRRGPRGGCRRAAGRGRRAGQGSRESRGRGGRGARAGQVIFVEARWTLCGVTGNTLVRCFM
jgi:hypothetical protein